ncbi:hypothetical protein DUT67_13975 [Pectobacterium peruviense]|nr:hypothetical protein [Pectobacterium peruviense]
MGPDGVGITGLIDTGTSYDAPAWLARHKKALTPCVVDEVSQDANPAP